MFEFLQTLQPILAGLALLLGELEAGWCLWTALKSEMGSPHIGPVSSGDISLVHRSRAKDLKSQRSHTGNVPATSA